jgi:hypothetical protein
VPRHIFQACPVCGYTLRVMSVIVYTCILNVLESRYWRSN